MIIKKLKIITFSVLISLYGLMSASDGAAVAQQAQVENGAYTASVTREQLDEFIAALPDAQQQAMAGGGASNGQAVPDQVAMPDQLLDLLQHSLTMAQKVGLVQGPLPGYYYNGSAYIMHKDKSQEVYTDVSVVSQDGSVPEGKVIFATVRTKNNKIERFCGVSNGIFRQVMNRDNQRCFYASDSHIAYVVNIENRTIKSIQKYRSVYKENDADRSADAVLQICIIDGENVSLFGILDREDKPTNIARITSIPDRLDTVKTNLDGIQSVRNTVWFLMNLNWKARQKLSNCAMNHGYTRLAQWLVPADKPVGMCYRLAQSARNLGGERLAHVLGSSNQALTHAIKAVPLAAQAVMNTDHMLVSPEFCVGFVTNTAMCMFCPASVPFVTTLSTYYPMFACAAPTLNRLPDFANIGIGWLNSRRTEESWMPRIPRIPDWMRIPQYVIRPTFQHLVGAVILDGAEAIAESSYAPTSVRNGHRALRDASRSAYDTVTEFINSRGWLRFTVLASAAVYTMYSAIKRGQVQIADGVPAV